jgi:hypothetical protein
MRVSTLGSAASWDRAKGVPSRLNPSPAVSSPGGEGTSSSSLPRSSVSSWAHSSAGVMPSGSRISSTGHRWESQTRRIRRRRFGSQSTRSPCPVTSGAAGGALVPTGTAAPVVVSVVESGLELLVDLEPVAGRRLPMHPTGLGERVVPVRGVRPYPLVVEVEPDEHRGAVAAFRTCVNGDRAVRGLIPSHPRPEVSFDWTCRCPVRSTVDLLRLQFMGTKPSQDGPHRTVWLHPGRHAGQLSTGSSNTPPRCSPRYHIAQTRVQ